MGNYAIISEFNPFHNGHKLLIDEAKNRGAKSITSIMSGSFVQRGQPALFSKFARTKCALQNGVDLVIELPVIYANSSANIFAYGGIEIANRLSIIDKIIFGSECGYVNKLYQTVDILNSDEFSMMIKKELKLGKSYARACNDAMDKISIESGEILKTANNTLAIEYIKALIKTNSKITAETIKRQYTMHDTKEINNDVASASHIRELICSSDDYQKLLPTKNISVIEEEICNGRVTNYDSVEKTLYYKLVSMTLDDIKNLPDVSEGLENRLYKAIRAYNTIDDIIEYVKTKRYTRARIRRILMSAYLGIEKEMLTREISYIRVLGFNQKGQELLKEIKNNTEIPIITKVSNSKNNLTSNNLKLLELDILANDLQAINFKVAAKCGEDYYTSHIRL